jgi:excinuclease ABC subunit C
MFLAVYIYSLMSYLPSYSPHLLLAWRGLPLKPGVYIFKDKKGDIIYVGKAKNLKTRVNSYFQPPVKLGPKTSAMMEKADNLEYIEVASELEALLLESRLIKKFKPFYNIISKDDKSPYYIHLTHEEYPKPVINHDADKSVAGPFLNRYLPTRILRQFRRVAPYCQSPRPVLRPCLYSHLGLCQPCPGEISTPDQKILYLNNISRLRRLLAGQFSVVRRNLTLQMMVESSGQNYEQAGLIRNQIQALDHLLITPITPDDYLTNPNLTQDLRQQALDSLSQVLSLPPPHRIEMYDNSHLSGTAPASAMVVAVNGEILPRLYRHFTIKSADPKSDVAMMVEVITRRLKNSDWQTPNLIVLDGGKPQLSSIFHLVPPEIKLISLAKSHETIVIPAEAGYREIHLPKSHPGLRLLMHLRDEAHRFSRRLHHKHRAKIT